MNLVSRWENRVVDGLYEGETTAADLARKTRLSGGNVRNILGTLINSGEVEARIVPDRSGEPGRVETRYSLVRTQRKRA